ncbi:hypothetical protein [Amycolatopsis magusensis]|uniref:hypothetical protein n=1 Tax=Amycolatopsis magusensis TaxID=882444 RepID=UPI0037BDB2BD
MSRRKLATARRLVALLDRERDRVSGEDNPADPQWQAGFRAGLSTAQTVIRKGL